MKTLDALEIFLNVCDEFGPAEAAKRLVPPQGSDSGDLLPDTRSGAGDKATTCNGSEKPLPDQGWGAKWHSAEDLPDPDISVIVATPAGDVDGGFWDGEMWRWSAGTIVGDGVTHWCDYPEAPRTQSVADGDEVEAAINVALACLKSMAAACDSAAELQEKNGIPDGAKASMTKAAACRDAFRVLECLLPELSRKERSVSGNSKYPSSELGEKP